MLSMAVSAAIFGTIDYFYGSMPAELSSALGSDRHRRFLADWWAHSASYASGFLGGLAICALVAIKRFRMSR